MEYQQQMVRTYVDSCWNFKKVNKIEAMVTSDFSRSMNGINVANGPSEFKAYIKNYLRAFPDLYIKVNKMIQKDNEIVTMWTFYGTNTGNFAEFTPTGKKAVIDGVTLIKFNSEGKMTKEDTYYNELYFLQQLGYSLTPPNLN